MCRHRDRFFVRFRFLGSPSPSPLVRPPSRELAGYWVEGMYWQDNVCCYRIAACIDAISVMEIEILLIDQWLSCNEETLAIDYIERKNKNWNPLSDESLNLPKFSADQWIMERINNPME